MRVLVSALIVCQIMSLSWGAISDDEPETDEALVAFNKGKNFFHAKQYGEAADMFRKAYKLKETWKLLYNIGQSEAADKSHCMALQAFEAYLSQGGDDIAYERKTYVLEEVSRLRNMVGVIQVKAPDGAVIWVDEVERGIAPMPGQIPVAASVIHTVVVYFDGEPLPEQTVSVVGGHALTVEFLDPKTAVPEPAPPELEIPEPPPPATPEPTPLEGKTPGSGLKTGGWVTFAVGCATLVGSVVTGGIAMGLNVKLKQGCVDGACPPEQHSDLENRDTLALTTDILLGVGGASVIAGMVMVIVAKGKQRKNEKATANAQLIPQIEGTTIKWNF
jgi:hypothetical protein